MLWEVKIAHQPLMVNTLPFITTTILILIIFSLMTVHIMRLLSLSSSSGSASGGHCRRSSPFLAICLLKVFVCKMNCCTGKRDDSLHGDDIELISEMLQNGLVDVYHET